MNVTGRWRCWYVKFKYKKPDSETIYDTTLQYWNSGDRWITKEEKITWDNK